MKIILHVLINIVSLKLMKNLTFKSLKSLINVPKRVAIIPHINPDGDAIGSSLGLYNYLVQKKHNVKVISPNDYADFLKWIPGTEQIINYDSHSIEANEFLKKIDIIFTLDFNSLSRCGDIKHIIESTNAIKIMIDHHEQPEDYADFTYSDTNIGSTCEMVYHFIDKLGDAQMINKDIGIALYTGILTDTASFRFPKTSATTHRVVAKLIENGVNHSKIHNNIYDNNSVGRLKLIGIALKNLKLINSNASLITLSQSELDDCAYKKGDTEGLVNYGLSIKGVILTAIFIENEKEGIIKISLRSKGQIDVNEIAKKYFNGGGHKNASGGKSFDNLENTVKQFKSIISSISAFSNE